MCSAAHAVVVRFAIITETYFYSVYIQRRAKRRPASATQNVLLRGMKNGETARSIPSPVAPVSPPRVPSVVSLSHVTILHAPQPKLNQLHRAHATPQPLAAGELLHNAQPLLARSLHPTVIVRGYRLALEDALKALDTVALPIALEDDEKMKAILKSSLATKFTHRYGDLMGVRGGEGGVGVASG